MTATEELRRMLDERGIEHDDYDPDPRYSGPTSDRKTEWDGASFREWPNGTIRFGAKGTTPAQAIAATVGAGTCHMNKETLDGITTLHCSKCGHELFLEFDRGNDWFAFQYPRFCPNCGKRVVFE